MGHSDACVLELPHDDGPTLEGNHFRKFRQENEHTRQANQRRYEQIYG